jgi:S1-C subfamily serine protease
MTIPRECLVRAAVALATIALLSASHASAQQSISEVFAKVKDSVVVIGTTERSVAPETGGGEVSLGGLGSGVLIDETGLVLTAAHVVQVADAVIVQLADDEIVPANVLGSVPGADLALLKLVRPPTGAVPARLGNSDDVSVGDQIFVVGAPLGISHTLTVGHISARRTSKIMPGAMMESEMFQTDAAINQGNSGGPMFNMKGEIIGIVSHMISRSGSYEGLGFVMTSNLARRLLLERRSIWSGFEGFMLSGDLARVFNVPQSAGILVQRVARDSLADSLGLQPGFVNIELEEQTLLVGGDIILEVLGVPVAEQNLEEIRRRVTRLAAGDRLTITVLRGGQRMELVMGNAAP